MEHQFKTKFQSQYPLLGHTNHICLISTPQCGKSSLCWQQLLPRMISKNNDKTHVILFSDTYTNNLRNQQYLQDFLDEYKYIYFHQFDSVPKSQDMVDFIKKLIINERQQDQIIFHNKVTFQNQEDEEEKYESPIINNHIEPKFILIFDDYGKQNDHVYLFSKIRANIGNSCIIQLMHSITDISKKVRNLCDVFMFQNVQLRYLKDFCENFLSDDINKIVQKYQEITNKPYQFFTICPFNPQNKKIFKHLELNTPIKI